MDSITWQDIALLVIIAWLVYNYIKCGKREHLVNRPDNGQRERMADQIMRNKNVFLKTDLSVIQSQMPWMDAVVYEDVRGLIRGGKLNGENLNRVLM